MLKPVRLANIHVDDATLPRHAVDRQTVYEYAESLKAKARFPPVVLFYDGKRLLLADGRHRLEAARRLGIKAIAADIRKGSQREAILYAVGANSEHGLRRTNADKRKAVRILLADKDWRKWADNAIAKQCRVSAGLVKEVRAEIGGSAHLRKSEDTAERRVERSGKVYTQKTGRIGRGRRPNVPTQPDRDPVVDRVDALIRQAKDLRGVLAAREDRLLAAALDEVTDNLQVVLGGVTGAGVVYEGLKHPLVVYEHERKEGIAATPEFAKKGLANYSACVGFTCGHQCTYCSTPALLRTHPAYKAIHQTAFDRGYAIIDPNTPDRIARDIPKLKASDIIQLSTLDDAWSPEAQTYDMGRRCLEVLLTKTPAQIRILTKSAEVAQEFDLIKKYRDRVMVGLSTGMPPNRDDVAQVVEPNASPIGERWAILHDAHRMGLRTYGMFCPCLPGIADSQAALQDMFDAALACGVEDIWLEAVNQRGKGLVNTEQALRDAGLQKEADAVGAVRTKANWSPYCLALTQTAIKVAQERKALKKLHVLLYSTNLTDGDKAAMRKLPGDIRWLNETDDGV